MLLEEQLFIACEKGDIKLANQLINSRADVNDEDRPLKCKFIIRGVRILTNELIKKGNFVNSAYYEVPLILAITDSKEITKLLINSILMRNLAEIKPNCIQNNEKLSVYWDKQVEKIKLKINYLLENNILGCKNSSEKTLNKIFSAEKASLLYLSFHSFFKSLNPEIIKNKTEQQLDVAPPKLG